MRLLPSSRMPDESKLRKTPPGAINVKACMLTGVPREEQLYAASAGARARVRALLASATLAHHLTEV